MNAVRGLEFDGRMQIPLRGRGSTAISKIKPIPNISHTCKEVSFQIARYKTDFMLASYRASVAFDLRAPSGGLDAGFRGGPEGAVSRAQKEEDE